MPAVDERMGFYEVAIHYYMPGWHQQSTFFELMINVDSWNTLSENQQLLFETACSANIRHAISEGEALQPAALERLEAEGVEIHTWPPEILNALEDAWYKVAQDMQDEDPNFKRVWQSLQAFRQQYKGWSDRGYLKSK